MEKISIYTDGSSLGNPGPGGWGAVMLFPDDYVKELGGGETHTTNNKMELTAILRALEAVAEENQSIEIFSDSRYAIQGITGWVFNWEKNNWLTKQKEEVLNRDIWQKLLEVKKRIEKEGRQISFTYVPGHVDHAGNERADDIARGFAEKGTVSLFEGKLEDSKLAGKELTVDVEMLQKRKNTKSRSRAKAYSYLSLVNGELQKHGMWSECEARVKGVAGAKYKKAISKEDEMQILKEWGVSED